jgi:hypothetical protein
MVDPARLVGQVTTPGSTNASSALYSYTRVASLLGSELGRQITYKLVDEATLQAAYQRRGLQATSIERDRAGQAGENARLTPTVREILGRAPSTLTAFLHEHREAFNRADT